MIDPVQDRQNREILQARPSARKGLGQRYLTKQIKQDRREIKWSKVTMREMGRWENWRKGEIDLMGKYENGVKGEIESMGR